VNFSRLFGIGFAVLIGTATATAGLAQYGQLAQAPAVAVTPVPTSPPTLAPTAAPSLAPTEVLTPLPTTTGRPRRGRRAPRPQSSGSPNPNASPSDTPEPPQFSTLDGVWEIELQPRGQRLATYRHVNITSTGASLTGVYLTGGAKGPKYPMTGTFDGRLISMTVSLPTGDATFNGYVEEFADMVGIYKTSDKDPGTAFTAQHRKKIKS